MRFFFTTTLGNDWNVRRQIPYARQERRLSVVLSQDEVARFFGALEDENYRVILMTAYGAGVRVSEIATKLVIR